MAKKKKTEDIYGALYGDVKRSGFAHTEPAGKKSAEKNRRVDVTKPAEKKTTAAETGAPDEGIICNVCGKGRLRREKIKNSFLSTLGWILLIFGVLFIGIGAGLVLMAVGFALLMGSTREMLVCDNCRACVKTA